MNIQLAFETARQRLTPVSETASLDAQVLLADLLGQPRAWILAHPEATLTPDQSRRLAERLARLEGGLPLPYELGHWEFFGLDFLVSPAALIPRPETELLVEHALDFLRTRGYEAYILDVGTGSGCIAVSLAVHNDRSRLVASDLSLAALRLARQNAQRHRVERRIAWLACDLLPPMPLRFDLICANLPYIPSGELVALPVARHEPRLALDGGADGLEGIRRLLSAASPVLAPGGMLLMEIEASQGERVLALARRAFPQSSGCLIRDLAGRDRLVSVQLT